MVTLVHGDNFRRKLESRFEITNVTAKPSERMRALIIQFRPGHQRKVRSPEWSCISWAFSIRLPLIFRLQLRRPLLIDGLAQRRLAARPMGRHQAESPSCQRVCFSELRTFIELIWLLGNRTALRCMFGSAAHGVYNASATQRANVRHAKVHPGRGAAAGECGECRQLLLSWELREAEG